MSFIHPSKRFCEIASLPYPADEALWHPDHFTFNALKEMLKDIALTSRVSFISDAAFDERINTAHDDSTHGIRIIVPVRFSPSQALEIARVMQDVAEETRKPVPATFMFLRTAETYGINKLTTQDIMGKLKELGFDIEISSALPTQSLRQMKRLHVDSADICHTCKGAYSQRPQSMANNGHPLSTLELTDYAYGEKPQLPADRFNQLPEVKSARRIEFLPALILGAMGTYEPTPEVAQVNGSRGFSPIRHEMS